MSFIEERISEGIVRGTVGGPVFSTQVNRGANGVEQRNINWDRPLGKWEMGERKLQAEQLDELNAFFRRAKGKAVGFRFRDWGDYKASVDEGRVAEDGGKHYLIKQYAAGETRWVRKPVADTVKVYRAGALIPATIDATTGELTVSGSYVGLTWEGVFDVPVRFDTDELKYRLDAFIRETGQASFYVYTLPLQELRL